jgi:hypothetical protein
MVFVSGLVQLTISVSFILIPKKETHSNVQVIDGLLTVSTYTATVKYRPYLPAWLNIQFLLAW